ncbi:polysaccharide biosynthesis/export family protein [Ruegeria sp. HKCCD7255]|uniref:polysaccharide biosynthesis/export family protein n=1 Tax=Ruegeria sp. HKCCD7255 TaxID=2683004 RepID=UPI001487DD26|nr:polysaccharide biosynthesis/export family protein [Ruegeria sp. HKCCD7255]
MKRHFKVLVLGAVSAIALSGCSSMKTPRNIEPVAKGESYQAQYRAPSRRRANAPLLQAEHLNGRACMPPTGDQGTDAFAKWSKPALSPLLGEKLSRNDMVQITIDGDELLSDTYVVSRDGDLKLPYLPQVRAQGRTTEQVERDVARVLVAAQFYDSTPRVTARISDFASVTVGVKGAVFEPHSVEIGGIPGDALDRGRQGVLGASTEARNLSVAIRASGGVRPDADLSAVELHRQGTIYRMDLRGVFEGSDPTDIMLLTGDQIVINSRGCFQDDLMRPSPISPPGVTLYMSNLTQPATGNAESAIGRDVREVPYGTRYLQAVVDTNCVGGAKTTNANRSAVLFTRNPMTGNSIVIERNIEKLLRRGDRDDYDPYVLPGDAIACYDSKVTGLTEVARAVGIVGAAALLAP